MRLKIRWQLYLIVLLAGILMFREDVLEQSSETQPRTNFQLVDSPAVPITSLTPPPEKIDVPCDGLADEITNEESFNPASEIKRLYKNEAHLPIDQTIELLFEVSDSSDRPLEMNHISQFYYALWTRWGSDKEDRTDDLESLSREHSNGAYDIHLAMVLDELSGYGDDEESTLLRSRSDKALEKALTNPIYDSHLIAIQQRLHELSLKSPEQLFTVSRARTILTERMWGSNSLNQVDFIKKVLERRPELLPKVKNYAEARAASLQAMAHLPRGVFPRNEYLQAEWLWVSVRDIETPSNSYKKFEEEFKKKFGVPEDVLEWHDNLNDVCNRAQLNQRWKEFVEKARK